MTQLTDPRISPTVALMTDESAFAVMERAQRLQAEGREVINLSVGQPDFPTPSNVVEAAKAALDAGHHGYTAPVGIAPLREAVISDLTRRYGKATVEGLAADNVLIVPGGKVTIYMSCMMLGGPNKSILYPDPGFPIYRSMAAASGARAIGYPLTAEAEFGIKAEDIISRVDETTSLIILNSPGNPTGGVNSKVELDKIAKFLRGRPDIIVMSDEIYSELLFDDYDYTTMLSYTDLREQVIILDGFSKTYAMTGWRLGYGIWPASLISKARLYAVNSYSCVNASAQYAGVEAMLGPRDEPNRMREQFQARRELLATALNATPGVSCLQPRGSFYLFVDISSFGLTSKEFADRLLGEKGVGGVSGSDFGQNGEGYIRLSYAASDAELRRAAQLFREFTDELNASK